MATTTNFGWTTPDDTDLVKDGASAIRTLGSAIDASLVDLKGGTTGQVLSKATGTDMDFSWRDISSVTLNDQTATYTAVLADANQKLVRMNVSTANNFEIPTDASVNFPIGSVINVTQLGTGQTTIQAVTAGTTTIVSTGASAAAPKLRARYSAASCIKTAANTWLVVGDLS